MREAGSPDRAARPVTPNSLSTSAGGGEGEGQRECDDAVAKVESGLTERITEGSVGTAIPSAITPYTEPHIAREARDVGGEKIE